jgi:hypothetical protein
LQLCSIDRGILHSLELLTAYEINRH